MEITLLVTYRDGLPARRRSPIQVLTGPVSINLVDKDNAAGRYTTPPHAKCELR